MFAAKWCDIIICNNIQYLLKFCLCTPEKSWHFHYFYTWDNMSDNIMVLQVFRDKPIVPSVRKRLSKKLYVVTYYKVTFLHHFTL